MTIHVTRLSKKYCIDPKRSDRFRDYFLPRKGLGPVKEFWALEEISFEVKKGERIGIVGRNGAGKSTLLKILNGITAPTRGSYHVQGRLVSLLEVGSGFHPELTGRENIFLYGSILGLSRKEIGKIFDAIVEFSEVGPFLDLPVKRFSNGMYARLGFSVAIHVEAEILVIDEVFSVGDLAFQQKCIAKLQEMKSMGVTLLFVGHHLSHLLSICDRGILLEKGRLIFDGDISSCIERYTDEQSNLDSIEFKDYVIKIGLQEPQPIRVEVLDTSLQLLAFSTLEQPLKKRVEFKMDPTLFHSGLYTLKVHVGPLFKTFPLSIPGEDLTTKQNGISLGSHWNFYDH